MEAQICFLPEMSETARKSINILPVSLYTYKINLNPFFPNILPWIEKNNTIHTTSINANVGLYKQ